MAKPVTQRELRKLLHYDSATGIFTQKKSRQNVLVGAVAGHTDRRGYVHIRLGSRLYLAHRLAWLYVTGQWPIGSLDHRDQNKSNNAWTNLRPADHSKNGANTGRRVTNKSGYKGVSWDRKYGKWTSRITVKRRQLFLGYYDDISAARGAYEAAATHHFGEFARAA